MNHFTQTLLKRRGTGISQPPAPKPHQRMTTDKKSLALLSVHRPAFLYSFQLECCLLSLQTHSYHVDLHTKSPRHLSILAVYVHTSLTFLPVLSSLHASLGDISHSAEAAIHKCTGNVKRQADRDATPVRGGDSRRRTYAKIVAVGGEGRAFPYSHTEAAKAAYVGLYQIT